MDAEVEVGLKLKRELTLLLSTTDGRSDHLAYIIYTTCRSCYLVFVWGSTLFLLLYTLGHTIGGGGVGGHSANFIG